MIVATDVDRASHTVGTGTPGTVEPLRSGFCLVPHGDSTLSNRPGDPTYTPYGSVSRMMTAPAPMSECSATADTSVDVTDPIPKKAARPTWIDAPTLAPEATKQPSLSTVW